MTTYTDEVHLRGAIPEMDQHKRSFELHLIDGPNLKIDYTPDIQETVKEAFNEYKKRRARLAARDRSFLIAMTISKRSKAWRT